LTGFREQIYASPANMRGVIKTLFLTWAGMSIALMAVIFLRGASQDQGPAILSPDDRLGLAEVFRLKKDWGDRIWPGFAEAEIPVLLFNDNDDFLVGAEAPPLPWEAIKKDDFAGRTYYRRVHQKRTQAFAVPLGSLWAGSIGTVEFMNSGRLPLKVSLDYWAVITLHEMFHAYQAGQAPERFKGALAVYAREGSYPFQDKPFAAAWNAEGAALAQAIGAPDRAGAERSAGEFVRLRRERRRRAALDPGLVNYERELEWLEGLAKYAEVIFYESAASKGAEEGNPVRYKPRFFIFQMDLVRLEKTLGGQAGDLRFYLSGMAQARLLDRLKPGWQKTAPMKSFCLEDLLQNVLRSGGEQAQNKVGGIK